MSATAKRKLDDIKETEDEKEEEIKQGDEKIEGKKKKKRKIQRCDTKEVNATAESISTILKTKSPDTPSKMDEKVQSKSNESSTTEEKKEDPVIESGFLAFTDTNPWEATSTINADNTETNDTDEPKGNTSWKFNMDDFNETDTTAWDFSGYEPTESKDKDEEKDKSKEDSVNEEEKKKKEETSTTLSYQKKLSNGEDNERVLCEIGQVKLYRLDSDLNEWVSCGEGRVRINVPTSSDNLEPPRIIMRNTGTNRVILNDLLRPQTEFKLDGTRIRITFVRPDTSVTFVLKFTRNLQRASEFAQAMTTLREKQSKTQTIEKASS